MAQTISLLGMDELQEFLDNLPEESFEEVKKVYKTATFNIHKKVTENASGKSLRRRTGELARSFVPEVSGTTLKNLVGRVFSNSPYAPIHETGGTIRAKRAYSRLQGGPYLNIPAKDNLTASGVQRLSARNVFSSGGYTKKINSLRAKYVVLLNGSPMFWLVKSVTLQPRLKFIETAEKEIPTMLAELRRGLQRGLENA